MGAKSELQKHLLNTEKEIMADVKKAVQETVSSSPEVALRRAAEKNKTADIRIYRKNPKSGKMSLFHTIPDVKMNEIDPNDFDTLCLSEGGGGTYTIKVKPPDQDPIVFGAFDVSGRTLHEPASVTRENPFALPSGFDTPGIHAGAMTKIRENGKSDESTGIMMNQFMDMMKTYQQQLTEKTQEGADRQMNLMTTMMQQQYMSSQQMMQMLVATMNPERHRSSSEDDARVRRLEEELRSMREERSRQEIQSLSQRMEDGKLTTLMEIIKANNSGSKSDNGVAQIMAQLLSAQQTSASQNTDLLLKIMQMANEKPSKSDEITSILSTMVGVTSTNLELLSKAAQQGLLGGSDHPVKDAIVRSLESAIETIPQILRGLMPGGAALLPPPHDYDDEDIEEMPPPARPQLQQAPQSQPEQLPQAEVGLGHLPQEVLPAPPTQPSAPQTAEQQQQELTPEQLELIQRTMMTEDDLKTIARDKALSTILARIQNGVSPKEISARIWNHANSPNRIAAHWFKNPEIITYQVIGTWELGNQKRAEAIIRDLIAFRAFLGQGGNPNDWPDTNYRPVRVSKPKKGVAQDPTAEDVEEAEEQEEDIEEDEQEDSPEEPKEIPSDTSPSAVNEGVMVKEVPNDDGIPKYNE